jgi:hypothetical protein
MTFGLFFRNINKKMEIVDDLEDCTPPEVQETATEAEKYTGHSLRRSSAAILVDAGTDITDLKRHGGWKSTTVAEGYIDTSINFLAKVRKLIMKCLW